MRLSRCVSFVFFLIRLYSALHIVIFVSLHHHRSSTFLLCCPLSILALHPLLHSLHPSCAASRQPSISLPFPSRHRAPY
ncbi:hypothetical protein C8R44DRAFT_813749 [Mycena epipterygia]|nr:hypothetical protein C8R44DRAFT_813749 [Mycena epipterygia]